MLRKWKSQLYIFYN